MQNFAQGKLQVIPHQGRPSCMRVEAGHRLEKKSDAYMKKGQVSARENARFLLDKRHDSLRMEE
jgi:hypothetical protein